MFRGIVCVALGGSLLFVLECVCEVGSVYCVSFFMFVFFVCGFCVLEVNSVFGGVFLYL